MSMAARLRGLWGRLGGSRWGRWWFSMLVGRLVPYSGTIRPRVIELEAGRALVELEDRRRVRNHLRSVHAMALANLGELATGLALHAGMADGLRGILTGFEIEYVKKARGTIRAAATAPPPPSMREADLVVEGSLRDAAGDVVARVRARWRVGPLPQRGGGEATSQ